MWSALAPLLGGGDGTLVDQTSEAPGLPLSEPRKVACGTAHSIYIVQERFFRKDTEMSSDRPLVIGWGGNRYNQLGMDTKKHKDFRDKTKIDATKYIDDTSMYTIVDEPDHELFQRQMTVDEEGLDVHESAFTGYSKEGGILEVACGTNHSVILEALKKKEDDGSLSESCLWSCGSNASCQLGRGPPSSDRERQLLQQVVIQNPDITRSQRVVVQRVCCGSDHTLVIANFVGKKRGVQVNERGRVFSWGLGSYGALGTQVKEDDGYAREVWFPGETNDQYGSERTVEIVQIAAGSKHSLALDSKGRVYSWGHGGNGRLGLGRTAGIGPLKNLDSCSAQFTPCMITANLEGKRIKYIEAGESHSGAVDELGGLYMWGQGSFGRCGHGEQTDIPCPKRVETLSGVAIKQIAFGLMHSVAMTAKGQLYAWGKGPATGLDIPNNAPCQTPRPLPLRNSAGTEHSSAFQIAAGALHTVVLLENGTLYCFGSGSEGRMPFRTIGSGAVAKDQTFPLKLDEFTGWRMDAEGLTLSEGARDGAGSEAYGPFQVVCGQLNTVALVGDASMLDPYSGEENMWVWGSGSLCGMDAESTQPVPRRVKVRMPIKMVALGAQHCLAVTANGLLFTWGAGNKGQLGTGTLKDKNRPQQVSHPADVKCVSAGEEHSGCITQGGECYTWGNADGGRLGLGNTMSEGLQLMPKMIERFYGSDRTEAGSVLLTSVSCGAQHTALVNDHHRLLTFGMGWFGRLGHGNLDNQYAPHFVDGPRELHGRVKDVCCGAYHTYIIDQDSMLWACGRETCICCDGLGHQIAPLRFEPFWKEPKRYIISLATHEQHALAIVRRVRSPPGASTELWAWGRNNRGQLGLPEERASRIDLPWQLKVPPVWEEDQDDANMNYELLQVSTGPGHSMCIVERTHPATRRRREHKEKLIYAWGCAGSDRLGISKENRDRAVVSPYAEDGNTMAAEMGPWGSRHMKIFPPTPVDDHMWRIDSSLEELDQQRQEISRAEDGLHTRSKEQSHNWLDIQVKMAAEDPANKPAHLLDESNKISDLYQVHMANIRKIWSRGDKGEVTEFNLRMRIKEVETEYIRTLQALKMGRTGFAPKMENRGKTDRKQVMTQMRYFEELFWILQQQPLYLRNVARLLWNTNDRDANVKLFERVCKQMYADLYSLRVRNVLKSLLRVLIEFELEKFDKVDTAVEDLFRPTYSRVSTLLTGMCTHPHFTKEIINPIMDPDNEQSLVALIIEYTLVDPKKVRKDSRGAIMPESRKLRPEYYNLEKTAEKGAQPLFTGLLATSSGEYDQEILRFVDYENIDRKYLSADNPWFTATKQQFPVELRDFYNLCHKNTEDGTEADQTVMSGKVTEWIQHFIHHTFKKCRDVNQIFNHTYYHLTMQQYAINRFKEDGGEMAPGICAPLVALLLGSVIGGVLGAVDSGPFGMLRWRIQDKVKREVEALVANRGKKNRGADDTDADWESYAKRVLWNIRALSKMFCRSAHAEVYKDQFAEFAAVAGNPEPEKPLSRACADQLKIMVQDELMKAFKSEDQDDTEMDLTVDLYRSHLSLDRSVVTLSTLDMLQFTNLLWSHMDEFDVSSDGDNKGIRLDTKERDRVYLLLAAIRPTYDEPKVARRKRSEMWGSDQLLYATHYKEKHNFTMRPRFLEFPWEGDAGDPTFCEESQAPIPRYIANKRQKARKGGGRAVKPFRTTGMEDLSKEVQQAFEHVEEILQELSGAGPDKLRFKIRSNTFQELQYCFSDFQKKIQSDIEEKHLPASYGELLRKLSQAKTMVEHKLMGGNIDEAVLLQYMDRNMRKRKEYAVYLLKAKTKLDEIDNSYQIYKTQLRNDHQQLLLVRDRTRTCEIPEAILSKAQQRAEALTFSRAKRMKQKMKNVNPTPAQLIFDQADNALQKDFDAQEVLPSRTFTIKEIERRGVLTKLNQKIPADMKKELRFTFAASGEGFEVCVLRGKACIKEFMITREEIQLMETAGKTAVIPFPRPESRNELSLDDDGFFLWMHSFRLRRLLAFLNSEGGLMAG